MDEYCHHVNEVYAVAVQPRRRPFIGCKKISQGKTPGLSKEGAYLDSILVPCGTTYKQILNWKLLVQCLQYKIPCISKEQIHQLTSLFPRIAIAKATVFRI